MPRLRLGVRIVDEARDPSAVGQDAPDAEERERLRRVGRMSLDERERPRRDFRHPLEPEAAVGVGDDLPEDEPPVPAEEVTEPPDVEPSVALPRRHHRDAQPLVEPVRLLRPVHERPRRPVGAAGHVREALQEVAAPVPVEQRGAVPPERQVRVEEFPRLQVLRAEDADGLAEAPDELVPALRAVVDAGVLSAGDHHVRVGEADAVRADGVGAAGRMPAGDLREARRVPVEGDRERAVLQEGRARADGLPRLADGHGVRQLRPVDEVLADEVGELVAPRPAARPVVAAVNEVEDVEPPVQEGGRHVADPLVVAVGRPVLDRARDRARRAAVGGRALPRGRGEGGRPDARGEDALLRAVRPGDGTGGDREVLVHVPPVNGDRPPDGREVERDVVDALRALQGTQRNAHAPRLRADGRLEDGAGAARQREVEVVPRRAVVSGQRRVRPRHAENEPHRARLVECLVSRDRAEVDLQVDGEPLREDGLARRRDRTARRALRGRPLDGASE